MYISDFDSIFISDYSWLQEFLDAHSIPNDPLDSQPSMAGHSIQTPDSFYDGYLNQDVINLDTLPAPHSLSDFSISHLPSTTKFEQITHKLSPENSLAVFSQPPSRPVVQVDPLNKDPQEQVTIETSQFKAHESSGSDEPRLLTLAVPHEQSGKIKAAKARAQSEKKKDCRKAYEQSEKGKAVKKTYQQSERGKAVKRTYQQSEKGMAVTKTYQQSEKGKATKRAYGQTEQRKAYIKAYYKVLRNTGDKEQAKIAGKQAAAFVRNKAKNNGLESTSMPQKR
ncbi:hypothetical protein [Endozoicomonas sp. ALB115]|uniref:hypothetical protein n=1 Tax=Endozoicomonas sp. ALB115 TaxID=3403074 RepID=UPI003BB5C03F